MLQVRCDVCNENTARSIIKLSMKNPSSGHYAKEPIVLRGQRIECFSISSVGQTNLQFPVNRSRSAGPPLLLSLFLRFSPVHSYDFLERAEQIRRREAGSIGRKKGKNSLW